MRPSLRFVIHKGHEGTRIGSKGLRQSLGFPIIVVPMELKGRLAQWLERLVHTEEVGGSNPPSPTTWRPDSGSLVAVPRWRNGRRAAFRAQCPYGRVGSNPSLGTRYIQSPFALVAQWIERCPAEAEVVGSNPAKRATLFSLCKYSLPALPEPPPVSTGG